MTVHKSVRGVLLTLVTGISVCIIQAGPVAADEIGANAPCAQGSADSGSETCPADTEVEQNAPEYPSVDCADTKTEADYFKKAPLCDRGSEKSGQHSGYPRVRCADTKAEAVRQQVPVCHVLRFGEDPERDEPDPDDPIGLPGLPI